MSRQQTKPTSLHPATSPSMQSTAKKRRGMPRKIYRFEILTPTTPDINRWRHLKVFVEVEVTTILRLGLGLGSGILVLLLSTSHDTSLLVITNTLLKEVGLAGK
jgi:hypothetical protein